MGDEIGKLIERIEYDLCYRVDRYFNTIQMDAADVRELVGEIRRLNERVLYEVYVEREGWRSVSKRDYDEWCETSNVDGARVLLIDKEEWKK